MSLNEIMFQIVLALIGLVAGFSVIFLPRIYQKVLAAIVAVLLVVISSGWIGYELGIRRSTSKPDFVLANSTFDEDTDGWTIEGGGEGPYYSTSGGNPGGYIYGKDASGEEADWYWIAPQKFLGGQSDAYGGVLFFTLTQHDTTDQVQSTHDVILVGGDTELAFDINNPGREWTNYAVWLHELGGWKKENGDKPTKGEMQRVLSALSKLKIHAEYRDGDDMGSLENVILLRSPLY
jgi:hypothetical protein